MTAPLNFDSRAIRRLVLGIFDACAPGVAIAATRCPHVFWTPYGPDVRHARPRGRDLAM